MTNLEKLGYSDDQTCIQPINFDGSKDSNKITRATSLNEWFTILYKRVYWMFRYCDKNGARKYQKQLKGMARRVQKGENFSFMNITDNEIEENLTSGKRSFVFILVKFLWRLTNTKLLDYDEAAYDSYFEERQDKIDEGEIIISSNDYLDDTLSSFEAIDWGIFGDYDYYYNY